LGNIAVIAGLSAGQNYTKTANLQLPYESSGAKYLILVTDGYNAIVNDSIGVNNVMANAINITASPNPDLIITSMSTPPSPLYTGSAFYLHYTIQNNGLATTWLPAWNDGLYFSSSNQITNNTGQTASIRHTGTLAAGAFYNDSMLVTVPPYL